MRLFSGGILALTALCACATSPVPPPQASLRGAALPTGPCPTNPVVVGRLRDEELDEISGIVESRLNPGVFFVHNDSGDSPRFFAIDRTGNELAELALEGVPALLDAEDIALGPGPGGSDASYVYLGDTGNNFASMGLGIPRRKAVLYRVAEPTISLSARSARLSLHDAFPIVLTFPDGARDVEAFFVDPRAGDLVMISKQPDGHSQVLTATAAQLAGGGGQLQLVGRLRFGHGSLPGNPMPTAADITADGASILVRTYSSVFWFGRREGEAAAAALLRPPRQLISPDERQGEAIAFADDGASYVTIPEGVGALIQCGRATPSTRQ